MKKFLSVILISMLVLTGAFAATANMVPSSAKPDVGVTSTVDVGLDVNPTAMTSYAFGFSLAEGSVSELGNKDNLTLLPDPFENTLALNYDAAKGIGTTEAVASTGAGAKEIWMYFKIQSGVAVTLEIEASQMTDQAGEQKAAPIDMTVTGTEAYTTGTGTRSDTTFTATSNGPSNGTLTITPTSAPTIDFNATSYKLKVETSKVPVLAKTANYLGTITVHVQGA